MSLSFCLRRTILRNISFYESTATSISIPQQRLFMPKQVLNHNNKDNHCNNNENHCKIVREGKLMSINHTVQNCIQQQWNQKIYKLYSCSSVYYCLPSRTFVNMTLLSCFHSTSIRQKDDDDDTNVINANSIQSNTTTTVLNEPDSCTSDEKKKNNDNVTKSTTTAKTQIQSSSTTTECKKEFIQKLMGESLQPLAGRLWNKQQKQQQSISSTTSNSSTCNDSQTTTVSFGTYNSITDIDFIPQVSVLGILDGRRRKRVLVLCTGGTLCMAPDPTRQMALTPVQGALSEYMKYMNELHTNDTMPDIVLHEYNPFYDSSDLGPADWSRVATDIQSNYLDFDGFVVLTGTDTMAYFATALSFMLENLGKPVIFTGSQIPLCEPYNDARRNLIMALIFACRDEPELHEVAIFFHDRLLRANRTTKVNTQALLAFNSPNYDPLATIGISINDNEHLLLPPPKGQLRVHSRIDTRILTLRLIPGFDDGMIREIIQHNTTTNNNNKQLQAMILQLYGTGNLPSAKSSLIQLLADAVDKEILVVAATQCHSGSVVMGQYAVGIALQEAGVVSANDMTIEATSCKIGYLLGRSDLNFYQIQQLIPINLRGEITPTYIDKNNNQRQRQRRQR